LVVPHRAPATHAFAFPWTREAGHGAVKLTRQGGDPARWRERAVGVERMHTGTAIEELRTRGLIAVLELRTGGDSELAHLLRPHKIRQIEAIVVALSRCAADGGSRPEWREPALGAIAEIRGALAVCLKSLDWRSEKAEKLIKCEVA
jgi:hypothetical protein